MSKKLSEVYPEKHVREDGNPIKHGLEGSNEPEPTLQFHELFIVGLVAAAIFAIIILGRANHVF